MTANDFQPAPTAIEPDEKQEKEFIKTTAGATLILLGLGLGWGLIGYFAERISLGIAIFIGVIAAYSVMGLVTNLTMVKKALMFFPSLIATLVTVVLGESVFFILVLINEYGATFGEAFTALQQNFVEFFSDAVTFESLLYGLIGGVIGFFIAARQD